MPFPDADLRAIIAAHPNKATGTLAGGATVDGIYTTPGRNIDLFNGSVSTTEPLFVIVASDATANEIDNGTTITINSQAYAVADTIERNDGMLGLPLTKG